MCECGEECVNLGRVELIGNEATDLVEAQILLLRLQSYDCFKSGFCYPCESRDLGFDSY